MTADAVETRAGNALAYQQQLEDLAAELQTGISAIESNSLPALESSIAKQELLCASLAISARAMGDRLRALNQPATLAMPRNTVDAEVDKKILATAAAVQQLNLQYASLIQHSGRSIALLSSLCRSHKGQFPEARGTRVNSNSTWSCQM